MGGNIYDETKIEVATKLYYPLEIGNEYEIQTIKENNQLYRRYFKITNVSLKTGVISYELYDLRSKESLIEWDENYQYYAKK